MTLTRGALPYKTRTVAWYDPIKGEVLDERDAQQQQLHPYANIAEVLKAVRARTLYILPDENGQVPGRPWYAECVQIGCKVDKYLAKVHSATIRRGEKMIDIYPIGQYFDETPDVLTCKHAWVQLASLLRGAFGEHALLMGTAGATGLHLLRLSLPKGERYEPLPEALREKIIHNFGQGRNETFYRDALLPRVFEIDGVWMYLSCLRDVPTGPYFHDTVSELYNQGYAPGFYRVQVRVPEGWAHIGLLPAYDEKAARRRSDSKTWYPATPGMVFESWCTSIELRFALEQGWQAKIKERIVWIERSSDPFRLWSERLRRLRERCDFLPEPERTMLRQAFRGIVLKAIGSLHRHDFKLDGYAPLDLEQEIPYEMWEAEDDETIHFWDEAEISKQQLEMLQPQWSGWVWGMARWKLNKAVLSIPYEQLVALRTDGIWTTYDVRSDPDPIWKETGKPGSWRVKYDIRDDKLAWPRTYAEMLALIGRAKKQGRIS